jgi:hypothetical protein
MRLAAASKLIQSMGVGSNTGSTPNAARALDFSFPIIENVLETRLTQGSRIDYFNFFNGYEYRLENAFVDIDSVVVRESSDGLGLVAAGDGNIVDEEDYYIDGERGLITLRRAPFKGVHTFSVAYDHGLPVDDNDEELLVGPQWLEEAAIAAGLLAINITPSVGPTAKNKVASKLTEEIRLMLRQILGQHLRPRMSVQYPSRSVDNG